MRSKSVQPRYVSIGGDFNAPAVPKKQANILIFGDSGMGKTSFTTKFAPDPIAHICYDKRAAYAVREAHDAGRRIHYMHIDFPANISRLSDADVRKAGHAVIDKTMKNAEIAVRESQKGNVRAICIDTATEYGDMVEAAFRGRADKVKDYGESKGLINEQLRRLCNLAREGDAHLIVLARAKPVWENNAPTGKFTHRCNEVFNELADWSGQIRLKKRKSVKVEQPKEWEIEVTKAGVDISQLGEVYDEEQWGEMGPFVWGCVLNYPGSEPSEWS